MKDDSPGFHERPSRRGSFRLGAFLVEPQRNRISGPTGTVSLQPKVMDVLCALAERQGAVLSRAELIDRVWSVEYGGDESLTQAISQLRKALGDTRAKPRAIETIAKRGYRLIEAVVPAEMPGRQAVPRRRRRLGLASIALAVLAVVVMAAFWSSRTPVEPAPALASAPAARTGIVLIVRPFASAAGAPPGAGLAEQLSAAISRSPLIRARAEGAAGEADDPQAMRYLLRGDIRRVGARLRVNVQLVDAATGDTIWGEGYERMFDAQFSARDSLVAAISRETQLPLLRAVKESLIRRPIMSLVPWQLILIVTWVPGDEGRPPGPPGEESYWLQRRALALDPDYAPAHALFAELAAYHILFHPPADTPGARARARGHATRAIELAPYDSEVLYQVALYDRFSGERERAAALLERVLDLQPNHPLAAIDLAFVRGQCGPGSGEAIARLTAIDHDLSAANPARWLIWAHLSALYLARGEYAQARDAALRSRRIIAMTWSAMTLAAADVSLGREAEARAIFAELRRQWPALDPHHFAESVVPRWCLGGPGMPVAQAAFRRLADSLASDPASARGN